MASRQDNLADILVQLASTSAQLIDRARASGVFKPNPVEDIVPTQVTVSEPDPQTGALQTIIVQQAMKISTLEAEVAALKADIAAMAEPKPQKSKAK
jgi:hypothetical protein